MNFQTLLEPEPAPWCTVETRQAAVLVDAEDYYATFCRAALLAKRSLCLAGWQFDSLARLLRPGSSSERGAHEHPIELLPFLEHLCERSPRLEVFILAWDYSLLYALEREWLQRLKFELQSHPRVHFAFSSHPGMGGCLHQKYALIDSRVAFVGGLDLCDSRWDTRAHTPADPRRLDVHGNPYKAFHDIQVALRGPVVKKLRSFFRESWERARSDEPIPSQPSSTLNPASAVTGAAPVSVRSQEVQPLPSEQSLSDSQPPEAAEGATDPFDLVELSAGRGLPLGASCVGLSRTDIVSTDRPPTFEVQALFERAILAAERLIYIETQYFTSRAIARAMCKRFSDPERSKLDVILVMPDGADTPKEDLVLGARQRAVRHRVARVAEQHGHRFRLLKSVHDKSSHAGMPATFIHSKLLIVDDELLDIGSANLTNRSMGLDTELNVSWATALENPRDAARVRAQIAALRADLLAEHAGAADASRFLALDGLIEAVDEACNDAGSKLCCQPIHEPAGGSELLSSLFDPASPLDWESVDASLRDAEDWLRT